MASNLSALYEAIAARGREALATSKVGIYVRIVTDTARHHRPFSVQFSRRPTKDGIIASGFFDEDGLDQLRDALRARLSEAGLSKGVDERDRIEGAHLVVARFA